MIFQIINDPSQQYEFKLQAIKIGDLSKKKVPKALPQEESKVNNENCEISSEGCQIQDDEIDQ